MVDVADRLVLAGLVDAHCHLDKTLFGGPWVPHSAGDALADRINDPLGAVAPTWLQFVARGTEDASD